MSAEPKPVHAYHDPRGRRLDDVDRALITALRGDGRLPLESLGRAAGLSGDGARERLSRLFSYGFVRVAGRVNPAALGLTTMGLAAIRISGDTVERQAQRLSTVAEYDLVMTAIGCSDLFVEAVCHDMHELNHSLDAHLRSSAHVQDLVFYQYLETFTYKPGGLNAVPSTNQTVQALAPDDVAIAEILQQDGRASYREIANRCNQPYQRVRRRVQHLIATGALQIETIVNESAQGQTVDAVVAVRVAGTLPPVCRALAALPEVDMGVMTTGDSDILLSVSCRDHSALVTLVTDTIRRTPGVVSTDSSLIVRVHKIALPWMGLGE